MPGPLELRRRRVPSLSAYAYQKAISSVLAHKGAGLLIDALPPACELIADRGYDSDGVRAALESLDIRPCIPSRKNRKHPHSHDPALYRQRHPIENLFAKLKDWRRLATRYADIFMGAITLAAIVIFWLGK